MYTIYTKDSCPFCIRAKDLLNKRGIQFTEVTVTTPEELPRSEFRTVPQILNEKGEFIGGFTELEALFNKKTVFSTSNIGHLTGSYPLFLGPDLGFVDNINQPYPILESLYDEQMGFMWNHTEVDLTQDRQDMLSLPQEVTDLMVETILWQTLADSVASRAIGSTILKYVSNSGLQDLYNAIILFETIHSKTYLHIIRQTFEDPNGALKRGYTSTQAIKRSTLLVDTFNNLLNASKETSEKELRKLIMFCVVALYLLENINFMASFAVTFAIAETGVYQGIASDVKLIARDEMLHGRIGGEVLRILAKEWPETFGELQPTFKAVLESVISDEHAWADHLFSNGRQVIGLNANLLKDYVNYMAVPVSRTLGISITGPRENPLPYMDSWLDSSKTQSAAQEIQLTNYLLNSIKSSSEAEIESILSKYR